MLIDYILFWLALAVMLSPLVLYALSWFPPRMITHTLITFALFAVLPTLVLVMVAAGKKGDR